MNSAFGRRRMRLWVMLAILAALGVVAMHAAHLYLGNRISTRALADEHALLGQATARVLAEKAADLLLVDDVVGLHELVASAVSQDGTAIVYCFVTHGDDVLASSNWELTPPAVVKLQRTSAREPVVIRYGERRILDLAEPVLDGELGVIRLGIDLRDLHATRRKLATELGLIALGLIALGVAAALWVGRFVAKPLLEMVSAADRFDPATNQAGVVPHGTREIAVLGERFNRMMERLRAAHAEQTRAREKAIATERLVALGTLVAGVAHEVNNPLAGLKNCVRRLERADLPDNKRREYLELMDESLARIEGVVRRLLDFGRPQPVSLVPMSAAALAEDAARFVRPGLERRRIQVEVLSHPGSPVLLADRRMASQGLVNLLLNAAHVTSEGGAVRLRIIQREGLVGVAVEDSGPGIPPELRSRVLDPFFSTKAEGEGTGLGLTVTRSIVEVHGGELTFDFPEHGGTIATLWLREAAPLALARSA